MSFLGEITLIIALIPGCAILAIALIVGAVKFIENINDWYRENHLKNTLRGTLSRAGMVIFKILYWIFTIVTHTISGLVGVIFIIGMPLMFVVLIVEAWVEGSWAALIFLSIIGAVGLYVLASKIYYKFKK